MEEFLIVYSTGGPDTFAICEGQEQMETLVAYFRKAHWRIIRVAKITPVEIPPAKTRRR